MNWFNQAIAFQPWKQQAKLQSSTTFYFFLWYIPINRVTRVHFPSCVHVLSKMKRISQILKPDDYCFTQFVKFKRWTFGSWLTDQEALTEATFKPLLSLCLSFLLISLFLRVAFEQDFPFIIRHTHFTVVSTSTPVIQVSPSLCSLLLTLAVSEFLFRKIKILFLIYLR